MYCFAMKTFKEVLMDHGFSLKEASARGIPYDTLAKHAQGARRVGAFSAARYEILLGIPRSELRPDLWPAQGTEQSGGTTIHAGLRPAEGAAGKTAGEVPAVQSGSMDETA